MKPGWYRAGGKDRYYLDEDGAWSIDRQDGSGVKPLENTGPADMEKFAGQGILVPEKEGEPPDLLVFGTGIMTDATAEFGDAMRRSGAWMASGSPPHPFAEPGDQWCRLCGCGEPGFQHQGGT